MHTSGGDGITEDSALEHEVARPLVADRITVALITKAAVDLQRLQARNGLSKTDLVNRAITLYEFIDSQFRQGRDLLIRDLKTNETRLVRLLG